MRLNDGRGRSMKYQEEQNNHTNLRNGDKFGGYGMDDDRWNAMSSAEGSCCSTVTAASTLPAAGTTTRLSGSSEDFLHNFDTTSRIKFTRKFTHQYKPCCCLTASLLGFLLSAAILSYLAYYLLKLEPGDERTFRGSFEVLQGKILEKGSDDNSSSDRFQSQTAPYLVALKKVFEMNNRFKYAFLRAEILAFDWTENGTMIVHFDLKFDPRLLIGADADTLLDTLKKNLHVPDTVMETNTFQLKENQPSSTDWSNGNTKFLERTTSSSPNQEFFQNDDVSKTVQTERCVPSTQLPFCPSFHELNLTMFPNLFSHQNVQNIFDDLILFREIIDSECFDEAAPFLCNILQPKCVNDGNKRKANVALPCRQFCRDFWNGCGSRLSEKLKLALDCFRFPEYSSIGGSRCPVQQSCDMDTLNKEQVNRKGRLCDGIIDCPQLEDELSCSYCNSPEVSQMLHCVSSKHCIEKRQLCDGEPNCPDSSDELNCLNIWPNRTIGNKDQRSTMDKQYFSEGYVTFIKEGRTGKICASDLELRNQTLLNEMADFICQQNFYAKSQAIDVKAEQTEAQSSQLYSFLKPDFSENSFEISEPITYCTSNRIFFVKCTEEPECGIQTANRNKEIEGLNKMAKLGDWPWHVALFKDGIHACDATLLSNSWLITTVSCFQGQSKAEWVAKMGAVRLNSGKSRWLQERHIVGMIKSPIEGSTLVLIKLSQSAQFTNIVRPICLLSDANDKINLKYCNVLGWNQNKMLQRIEVRLADMDYCANISITTSNSICADSIYQYDQYCQEDEMAGNGMACLIGESGSWSLIGVSNWKISCLPADMQRPRLYDKISSNINWIRSILSQS